MVSSTIAQPCTCHKYIVLTLLAGLGLVVNAVDPFSAVSSLPSHCIRMELFDSPGTYNVHGQCGSHPLNQPMGSESELYVHSLRINALHLVEDECRQGIVLASESPPFNVVQVSQVPYFEIFNLIS
jgi:hypothetical protein